MIRLTHPTLCSLALLLTLSSVFDVSWASARVKRDILTAPPAGWTIYATPSADHPIILQVGLKQSNFSALVEELYQVSNPDHHRYGQYLSKSQVENFVKPHVDALDAVNDWLLSHSIDLNSVSRSPAQDWATITVPVSLAETMLESKYYVFHHEATKRKVVRTLEYSLPRELADHIDTIQPTTFFGLSEPKPAESPRRVRRSVLSTARTSTPQPSGANCSLPLTPACLRSLYKTDQYTPSPNSCNKLGIVSYSGDYANNTDLQAFFAAYRPEALGSNFSVVLVNGGKYNESIIGDEATLDVQLVRITLFTAYDTQFNTNEPYLDWVQFVLNQTDPPQTFTTSYADPEQTVPRDYAERVCASFAQLGARGVSLLFGSGDAGVGGGACTSNDGTNTTRFQPTFPATCPFVTVVGGTAGVNPEVAADGASSANFVTGGGFSNYFARPDYQSKAVEAYLQAQGSTYAGLYNATGRAYPDFAAQGNYFTVIIEGEVDADSGTSASTPAAAAVISLLNDYLISRGKPPLGFLNPFLYSKGYQGLNDILSGSNEGCGTDGFASRAGWDPVTGLGTPDFVKLQALVG